MKAQILYNAQNDGVISGQDMQEFFLQVYGDYSISGDVNLPTGECKALLKNSLRCQERNSPSMASWCAEMRTKYKLS